MPKTYQFNEKQIEELVKAKKINKNKNVDKRLEALLMRAAKASRAVVSAKTGFCKQYITDLTTAYQRDGLSAIVENHYRGNRRNMSFEEEEALLSQYSANLRHFARLDQYQALRASPYEPSHTVIMYIA